MAKANTVSLARPKKKKKPFSSDSVFNTVIVAIICVQLVLVLYPLIFVLSASFSSGIAVTSGQVLLWPVQPDITGYQIVFSHRQVWISYANTIFYTVLGSIVHTSVTIMAAYPLSRKTFQGRGLITGIFTVTMFFGGGMIPSYILVSSLNLVDTRTWMIISGCVAMSHIIIMRTFFQTNIPNELLESAKLDGISDFGYLLKIVIPLSKASISVILLYTVVGHWNSYMGPMIYLRDRNKYPLQLVLQEILSSTKIDQEQITDSEVLAKLTGAVDVMKYALIVVSTVPMLVLYPFVQKFFEKGVMMGSVKG